MPRYMTSDDIRALVAARVQTRRGGRPRKEDAALATQATVARELGVTQGYLSLFLAGIRRHPAATMLHHLGFDREPCYRKRDE